MDLLEYEENKDSVKKLTKISYAFFLIYSII